MIYIHFFGKSSDTFNLLKYSFDNKYIFRFNFLSEGSIQRIREDDPSIIILEILNEDQGSIGIIKSMLDLPAAPPIIVLSKINRPDFIVKIVKLGIFDFISLPFEKDRVLDSINDAYFISAKRIFNCPKNFSRVNQNLIGESNSLKKIASDIVLFSKSDAPILITGESGTGKEIVSSVIHELSDRNKNHFIALNCGAIPEHLIETEFFGSEKGAFTEAVSKPGFFEIADKGTLFLDEIAELNNKMQAALLRAIENKKIVRVGSSLYRPIDTRIISATNKNLKIEIENGRFREDLYYRINVLNIELPPLRERIEDIPLLCSHFLKSVNLSTKKTISKEALDKLKNYKWPGNVRELKNVITRAVLLENDKIIGPDKIIFN